MTTTDSAILDRPEYQTPVYRRRLVAAIADWQQALARELAYLPHLQHTDRIAECRHHIDRLTAALHRRGAAECAASRSMESQSITAKAEGRQA